MKPSYISTYQKLPDLSFHIFGCSLFLRLRGTIYIYIIPHMKCSLSQLAQTADMYRFAATIKHSPEDESYFPNKSTNH